MSGSDKSDSTYYRKSARSASFNHQPTTSSGVHGKGAAPAPSPSLSSSNQSFKKPSNVEAIQSRVVSSNASASVENSSSSNPQIRGSSNTTIVKPNEAASGPDRGTKAPPTSQSAPKSSDIMDPATPVKSSGGASKAVSFQFGSLSPSFVNGIQLPVRTSSVPINVDEQRRDKVPQAHDTVKTVPPVPAPHASISPLQKMDLVSADQSATTDVHLTPKLKNNAHQPVPSVTQQLQKTHVHQVPGVTVPMNFHQPKVALHFSGPSPHIIKSQPPVVPSIPVPLPIKVQQQMFVPGIPSYPMPRAHGLSFMTRGNAQLGNRGLSAGQHSQQQGVGQRKSAVKITHPDTHQEVRLDKQSDGGPSGRSHTAVPPLPQPPISAYPPGHQINYFNNYNPMFFHAPIPTSPPSSGTRFSYPVAQGLQKAPFMNSPASNTMNGSKKGSAVQITAKSPDGSVGTINMDSSVQSVSSDSVRTESPKVSEVSSECMQKESGVGLGGSSLNSKEDKLQSVISQGLSASISESSSIGTDTATSTVGPSDILEKGARSDMIIDSANSDHQLQLMSSIQLPEAVTEKRGQDEQNHTKVNRKQDDFQVLGSNDMPLPELTKSRSTVGRGRKKRREIVQKADATGTTSDLYVAYKGPEKNTEAVVSSEIAHVDAPQEEIILHEKGLNNKDEPNYWEDAQVSPQQLKPSANAVENGSMNKKYSRDFLLNFADHTSLPDDCKISSDTADAFSTGINMSPSFDRDSPRTPGRTSERKIVGPRLDRRGSGLSDGVLRNSRPQSPGYQGGIQRNGSEADRWQRVISFQQKGLIPSPPPQQMMHNAERKYEVGKVKDEEEAKQRQLKGILNKLTPQNFEKLFEQVLAVNIDNAVTLTGLISQIFDKALMEPTFCEMYANLCSQLSQTLPDLSEENEKITFKRLLLNKCQEEFERGEREQEEANKVEEEGEVKQSEEEREEKRIKARRRMLGNIRLIGELYKERMLTEKIMHECIKKLMGQNHSPHEEDLEALCKLMSTIGEMIDHPKAKGHMDAYYGTMSMLSNNMDLSSRFRFMLKDTIDLRKNKWQQRRKVEGPKKIEEVHRDAAQERNRQSRMAHFSGMNSSGRRGSQMDFASRAASLSSPSSFCGLPSQARFEERQPFEARTLTHRSTGNGSITLGPQGGLGRGMSVREAPLIANPPVSSSFGDSRRTSSGKWSAQGGSDTRSPNNGIDKPYLAQNNHSEKVWREEKFRDMSIDAIKEYYSVKDEKEVALCIKDLNCPSFYPSMVSLWVTDSFERKDNDRDLLTKLLINLTKSHDAILSQLQIIQGFESVLTTLEDAVNDAPKAAQFLGRMFGKVIVEDVVALNEIGRILHEGGEEPGRLLEVGIAADVLGSMLELIQLDKGEAGLNEIRRNFKLRLEDFRPLNPIGSMVLEKFL